MKHAGPALQGVERLMEISRLPASMNGNPFLYVTTLTAVMCGTVMGLFVMCWMAQDLIRDRHSSKYKSILFNFRLMMGLAGLAAFMACLPEVLYLQMYGDPSVSAHMQAAVTTGKRVADSLRIFVLVGWVGILGMIYPYVCLALIDVDKNQKVTHLQVEDYPGLKRLVKPAIIFAIIAMIAMAFAYSKVYRV